MAVNISLVVNIRFRFARFVLFQCVMSQDNRGLTEQQVQINCFANVLALLFNYRNINPISLTTKVECFQYFLFLLRDFQHLRYFALVTYGVAGYND